MTDPADFSWLRVMFAFSVVLVLMAGLGWVLKYVSARGFILPSKATRMRRMKIVESLAVDTKRRLVIVSCDSHEHLLLIGGQDDIVIAANLPPAPNTNAP
jgi:flagellar biogenesis protein FliO